jgi:hypothetical protein
MWNRLSKVFKTSQPLKNGRWALESKKTALRKIDLANHDHCGGPLCAETKLTKSKNTAEYDNGMDAAICALQSFHVNPTKNKLDKN